MNYSILRETLIEDGFSDYHEALQDTDIIGIRYWEKDKCEFDPSQVYLLDMANSDSIPLSVRVVICMTWDIAPSVAERIQAADIIIPPTGYSPWLVMDKVWSAIRDHERWVQSMMRCVLQGDSISQFLKISGEKLCNPIAVLDQNFRVLARSVVRNMIPTGTIWDSMWGERFDMTQYYSAKERVMISRAMGTGPNYEVLFHPARDPGHTYYSAQLEIDETAMGCIGIVDVFAPLTRAQCAIAREVRNLLADYLKRNMRSLQLEEVSSGFWFNLITGGTVDTAKLNEKMADRGWHINDTFTITTLQSKETNVSQIELTVAVNQALMELPHGIVAADGKNIAILLRVADYGDGLNQRMLSFSQATGLCIGYSTEFSDLSYCGAAYKQSVYAASCARKRGEDIMHFSQVHAEYIMDVISHHEVADACIDLRLLRLANSPRQSTRLLLPCLKAYLLNGRNIAETARALYLHRNTVIYRIENLSQQLGIDFDNMTEEELFSLLISCYLVMRE